MERDREYYTRMSSSVFNVTAALSHTYNNISVTSEVPSYLSTTFLYDLLFKTDFDMKRLTTASLVKTILVKMNTYILYIRKLSHLSVTVNNIRFSKKYKRPGKKKMI